MNVELRKTKIKQGGSIMNKFTDKMKINEENFKKLLGDNINTFHIYDNIIDFIEFSNITESCYLQSILLFICLNEFKINVKFQIGSIKNTKLSIENNHSWITTNNY
jgi:hypothetical protein